MHVFVLIKIEFINPVLFNNKALLKNYLTLKQEIIFIEILKSLTPIES